MAPLHGILTTKKRDMPPHLTSNRGVRIKEGDGAGWREVDDAVAGVWGMGS